MLLIIHRPVLIFVRFVISWTVVCML